MRLHSRVFGPVLRVCIVCRVRLDGPLRLLELFCVLGAWRHLFLLLAYQLSLKINLSIFGSLAAADLWDRFFEHCGQSREANLSFFIIPFFTSTYCPMKPKLRLTEFDLSRLGVITNHSRRTCDLSSAFGVFTAHKMATTASSVDDLAGGAYFNSFAQPFVGFLFWHLSNSLKSVSVNLQSK